MHQLNRELNLNFSDIYICCRCGNRINIPEGYHVAITLDCPKENGCGRKSTFYREEFEKYFLGEVSVEGRLHPGGSVLPEIGLVIEPIGRYQYLYKMGDKKGIARACVDERNNHWLLTIEGKYFLFEGPPLLDLPFPMPPKNLLKDYIEGKIEIKEIKKIFSSITNVFPLMCKMSDTYYYIIAALFVLQSWLSPVLPAVFYLGLVSPPGGGKTSFLETLQKLCYHGCLASNISPAAIARLTQKGKLTLLIDEIDKSSEIFQILKVGYRRENLYIRMKKKNENFEEEICDVFGAKAFAYSTDIEEALKSRTIVIPLTPSEDPALPIFNLHKNDSLQAIFNDLFFWYMENIVNVAAVASSLSCKCNKKLENLKIEDGVCYSVADVAAKKESIFSSYIDFLSFEGKEILINLSGRNAELAYIMLYISHLLNLKCEKGIAAIFEKKKEMDNEAGYIVELIEEILREEFSRAENQIMTGELKGCPYIEKSVVYSKLLEQVRRKGLKITEQEFQGVLLKIGFREGKNMKRERFGDKIRKALILDEEITKRLFPATTATTQQNENYMEEKKEFTCYHEKSNNSNRSNNFSEQFRIIDSQSNLEKKEEYAGDDINKNGIERTILSYIPYEPYFISLNELLDKFGLEERDAGYLKEKLEKMAWEKKVKMLDFSKISLPLSRADLKWAEEALKTTPGMSKEFFINFFIEKRGDKNRELIGLIYDNIVEKLKKEGIWKD